MKVTPRPSGQPSCLTDVETKIQKAEGPCFCSHSMQAGLEPRIPISYHCGIKRLCGSAGAGLFLTQASRWVAEEWVPRTLGSLWGKEEGPGARSQLWCLWAHTRGRPVDLCLEPVSPGLERHLKRLCALKTSLFLAHHVTYSLPPPPLYVSAGFPLQATVSGGGHMFRCL